MPLPGIHTLIFDSAGGDIFLFIDDIPSIHEWTLFSYSHTSDWDADGHDTLYPWGWITSDVGYALIVTYWFVVVASAICAAVPWLRWLPWRFSLRTMLLATTAIAVVLGLVVWATRS